MSKKRKKQISPRERERRMLQSAYSPRKISEAEADRWLENSKTERAIDREIEREHTELLEWNEERKPGAVLRIVASMILLWLLLFVLAAISTRGC